MNTSQRKRKKLTSETTDQKYWLYENSVQDPKHDLKVLVNLYKDVRGKLPTSIREDFCGTFQPSCEWVKSGPRRTALALDLDPEPLAYGMKNHYSRLTGSQKKRLKVLRQNVISVTSPKVDFLHALNFSYFCLKQRKNMLAYLKACRRSLNKNGVIAFDVVGGLEMGRPRVDRKKMTAGKTKFTYIWRQNKFDAITNDAFLTISFKLKDGTYLKNAFTYDWRLWSLPELRDLFVEAGFKKTFVYWEGTTKDGVGNGVFTPVEHEENCEVWIAYLIGAV